MPPERRGSSCNLHMANVSLVFQGPRLLFSRAQPGYTATLEAVHRTFIRERGPGSLSVITTQGIRLGRACIHAKPRDSYMRVLIPSHTYNLLFLKHLKLPQGYN